jgi:hypothetical protein
MYNILPGQNTCTIGFVVLVGSESSMGPP